MSDIEGIKRGMALAFFASAYADQADESGRPLSGEIMDQLPDAIDPESIQAAERLTAGIVGKYTFKTPDKSTDEKLTILWAAVNFRYEGAEDKGDRELTPELFGHYCAMQAMGHGVGLESFGDAVRDYLKVPYLEFGACSLSVDYFPIEGGHGE